MRNVYFMPLILSICERQKNPPEINMEIKEGLFDCYLFCKYKRCMDENIEAAKRKDCQ